MLLLLIRPIIWCIIAFVDYGHRACFSGSPSLCNNRSFCT